MKCIRMLTFLPIEEIEAMSSWEGSQLNEAKDILAYELTKLVHGEEEAERARAASRALFAGGVGGDVPTVTLADSDFTDGKVDILTMLVSSGLVPSRSEARRAVQQGGVTLDGEKITDIAASFTKEDLADGRLLRRGKKSYKKIMS